MRGVARAGLLRCRGKEDRHPSCDSARRLRACRAREWRIQPWGNRAALEIPRSSVRTRGEWKFPRSAKAPRSFPQAALRLQPPEARLVSSRGLSKNEARRNFLLRSSRQRECGARLTFLRSRERRDTLQVDEAKEEFWDSASISP